MRNVILSLSNGLHQAVRRIAVLAGIILLIRFRPRGLFPTETRR